MSKGKFAPPSALNSGLPGGLDAWFKRAFHKNLSARFSSAKEMKDAFLDELRKADLLPAWAEPGPVEVGPTSRAPSSGWAAPRPISRRRVRRTRVAQVGAALRAFLAIGVGLLQMPARAKLLGVAAVAGESAHAWAVHAGFYPAALATADDAHAPMPATSLERATDVTWVSHSSPLALAERDGEGGRDARLNGAGTHFQAAGDTRLVEVLRLARFDEPAPPVRSDLAGSSDVRSPGLERDPYATAETTTSVLDTIPASVAAPASTTATVPTTPGASPRTSNAAAPAPPPDLATVRFGL